MVDNYMLRFSVETVFVKTKQKQQQQKKIIKKENFLIHAFIQTHVLLYVNVCNFV